MHVEFMVSDYTGYDIEFECSIGNVELISKIRDQCEKEYLGAKTIWRYTESAEGVRLLRAHVPHSHPLAPVEEVSSEGDVIQSLGNRMFLNQIKAKLDL
jgi:hypothetical protein